MAGPGEVSLTSNIDNTISGQVKSKRTSAKPRSRARFHQGSSSGGRIIARTGLSARESEGRSGAGTTECATGGVLSMSNTPVRANVLCSRETKLDPSESNHWDHSFFPKPMRSIGGVEESYCSGINKWNARCLTLRREWLTVAQASQDEGVEGNPVLAGLEAGMFQGTASWWRRLTNQQPAADSFAATATAEDERRIWVRHPCDLQTQYAPDGDEPPLAARILDNFTWWSKSSRWPSARVWLPH